MIFAVCDDEKVFRKTLTDRLYEHFGRLELDCAEFSDGSELIAAFERGDKFDAVFLDIEMREKDGLKTAAFMRKNKIDVPVIFLTSHTEFAMDGYEVAAFRFLKKPLQEEKLSKTLEDLKEELLCKRSILIRSEGEDMILLVGEIIYIEAQNNSVRIVLTGTENGSREFFTRKKLSVLEKELSELSDAFTRIHRGYLVNLKYVKKNLGTEVLLCDQIRLPVSKSYVKEFRERLIGYIRNCAR